MLNSKVQKKKIHDRSLSFDVSADVVSFMNNSHLGLKLESRDLNQSRLTPINFESHNSMKNILEENTVNSSENSPTKPSKPTKTLNSASQQNSAAKYKPDPRYRKLERVSSVYLDVSMDQDNSVSRAIQIAFELQAEREKNIVQNKIQVENELNHLKKNIEFLSKESSLHEEGKSTKLLNLQIISSFLKKNENFSNERSFNLDMNKSNYFQALSKLNKQILDEYKKFIEKKSEKKILQRIPNYETMSTLVDEQNLLTHKLETAQEKVNIKRELRQMIEEDFTSRVESSTECIFLQEEMENILETLKKKSPEGFELIKEDFEVTKHIDKLDEEYTMKNQEYYDYTKSIADEQIKYDLLYDKNREMDKILEDTRINCQNLINEIIYPQANIKMKIKDSLRSIISSNEENINRILSFFSLFDLSKLDQNSVQTNIDMLLNFQYETIEEVLFILKGKKDIQNLENTIVKLHPKQHFDDKNEPSQVIKSLQTELLNKKLALTQKASQYETRKKKFIKGMKDDEVVKFLHTHSEQTFYEIFKRASTNVDPSTIQKIEQAILIVLTTAKEGYITYFEFRNSKIKGSDNYLNLNRELAEQQDLISSMHDQLTYLQQSRDVVANKLEDFRYQQDKLREKVENLFAMDTSKNDSSFDVAIGKQKTPRKEKSSNWFSKLKKEIQDAYTTLAKVEKTRENNNYIIENELKPNYEKTKSQLVEFTSKIAFLRKEMFALVEKQQDIFGNLERGLFDFINSVESKDEWEFSNITYILAHEFIAKLFDFFCCLISENTEILIPKNERMRLSITQQDKIQYYLDNDNARYEKISKELQIKKNELAEKESKYQYLVAQLEKSRHFCEVTDQLMKSHTDKENCFGSSNVLGSNNSILGAESSGKKNLYSSKSSSRLHAMTNQSKSALPSLKLNFEQNNSKVITEIKPQNNSLLDTSYSGRSIAKNSSSTNILTPNSQSAAKSSGTDRSFIILNNENNLLNVSAIKVEKTHKCLNLEPARWQDAVKEFETGLNVLKKFSTNSNYYGPRSSMIGSNSKNQSELQGFGNRILRLNCQSKAIEIIKTVTPSARPMVEYSHEWKNVKKVFIPLKTIEQLKRLNNSSKPDYYAFSIDVQSKGRIDFMTQNPNHETKSYHRAD